MTNALEGDAPPFGPVVWTVNFDEVDGRTTLTTRVVCQTVEDRDMMERMQWRGGYGMSLDKLAGQLKARDPAASLTLDIPTDQPVLNLTRWFDAPRALVWKTMSEAEHFKNWWGPRIYACHILEMDVRVGGKYRIEQRGANGEVHPFAGEYVELDAPRRMVFTQAYGKFPPLTVTIELADKDGGTLLTSQISFDSVQGRDGMVSSGMEWGMRDSYARLDALLDRLDK
jgi:uncharacterized protein YndB with AHSA1/START domain